MSFLKGEEIVRRKIVNIEDSKQIQPCSVELIFEEIHKFTEDPECLEPFIGAILRDKTYFSKECYKLAKLTPTQLYVEDQLRIGYYLNEGFYIITLQEVRMLKNCFGILTHRSSVQRLLAIPKATIIDPAYHGKPKVLVYVKYPIFIEEKARLFHLVVYCSEEEFKEYQGQYQHESL